MALDLGLRVLLRHLHQPTRILQLTISTRTRKHYWRKKAGCVKRMTMRWTKKMVIAMEELRPLGGNRLRIQMTEAEWAVL
jgi:hypothetical protein